MMLMEMVVNIELNNLSENDRPMYHVFDEKFKY